MGGGTAAQGKRSGGKSHMMCRRCGRRAYHVRHKVCSSCSFGRSGRLRSYAWSKK